MPRVIQPRRGRIAVALLVLTACITAWFGLLAWAGDETQDTRDKLPGVGVGFRDLPTFRIAPIEGLTTEWHLAPPTMSVPLGTELTFFQPAAPGDSVVWTGAIEFLRDETGSSAVCPLVETGMTTVTAHLTPATGDPSHARSEIMVEDVAVDEITVSIVGIDVGRVFIDESLPEDALNRRTMQYFFSEDSIAGLRDLGDDRYRTSTNRQLRLSAQADPPGFSWLIEWTVDDEVVTGLGRARVHGFDTIGTHVIAAGPAGRGSSLEIETYGVTITSHVSGVDQILEGEPVTFEAVTDPPGYEDDITWLSSTMFGTGQPVMGAGPTFTVQFDDTFEWYEGAGSDWQWLGVKADDVTFNQDTKVCPVTEAPECAPFQQLDCADGDTTEICLPKRVIVFGGEPKVVKCECFGADECRLAIDGTIVFCVGECPDPDDTCQIFLDGVPAGTDAVDTRDLPENTLIDCRCAEGPPPGECTSGFDCGEDLVFCNDSDVCICLNDFDGGFFCGDITISTCDDLIDCPGGTGDCPAGFLCAVGSCCAGPECIPICESPVGGRDDPPSGSETLFGIAE